MVVAIMAVVAVADATAAEAVDMAVIVGEGAEAGAATDMEVSFEIEVARFCFHFRVRPPQLTASFSLCRRPEI